MKDIKPTWFIEHPVDQEYKQYILLDFLSTVNKDIADEDIYYPVKRIFSMIKEISSLKVWIESNFDEIPNDISKNIREVIQTYENSQLSKSEKEELFSIIETSLNILYKYADLGMDLWKNIESRIKAFSLSRATEDKNRDRGILIFRNMSTDHLISYWWQSGKTDKGSKGTMLKKILLRNSYYSMSYEFTVHEILDSMDIKGDLGMEVNVMEIYEDFSEESVTLKIAKELFIREISKEEREKN
jgi:hypothetical protein